MRPAHVTGSTSGAVDVVAVEQDLALDAGAGDQVVHAVEERSTVDLPQPDGR